MTQATIDIRKVWRSEMRGVILCGALSVVCVLLSRRFPGTVIRGQLFEVNGTTVWLSLPLLWFGPFLWASMLIFRIYNVRYLADPLGLEAYEGICSFSQKITRIRYEDVRSIETDQNLFERILDVGSVEVGTAGTVGVEMIMQGISAPNSVQTFIQNERDRRHSFNTEEYNQEGISV